MKHLALFLCFSLCSELLTAQSGYYYKYTNFSDLANEGWLHHPSEQLGTILLNGYLTKKLNAYQFDVSHKELKWKLSEETPLPWEPGEEYYGGAFVTYEGKSYKLLAGLTVDITPPAESNDWIMEKMPGSPVSFQHSFPVARDTTTKEFLFNNMLIAEPMQFDAWDLDVQYFANDIVSHKRINYEARQDTRGAEPGGESIHWRPLPDEIGFYSSSDLDVIRVLYHYKMVGNDTIRSPQMLSVLLTDMVRQVPKNVGLNFYYNDVIKYLSGVPLPQLHQSNDGYMGNGNFTFDEHTKPGFMRWLLRKIQSNEIKIDKKWIVNTYDFEQLLKVNASDINSTTWFPVQNPQTLDIRIIAGKTNTDYQYYTIPVVTLPWKSIGKFFKPQPPPFYDYRNVLNGKFLRGSIDTVFMDSVDVLPVTPVPSSSQNSRIFYEYQFDDFESDQAVAAVSGELWGLLTNAWGAKNISTRRTPSLHPCDYDFNGVTLQLGQPTTMDYRFTFCHLEDPPTEVQGTRATHFGIVYERNISMPSPTFQPFQVVITMQDEQDIDPIDYRFDWSDVKKLLAGKANFGEFIKKVESGSLNLNQSAMVYALTSTLFPPASPSLPR